MMMGIPKSVRELQNSTDFPENPEKCQRVAKLAEDTATRDGRVFARKPGISADLDPAGNRVGYKSGEREWSYHKRTS